MYLSLMWSEDPPLLIKRSLFTCGLMFLAPKTSQLWTCYLSGQQRHQQLSHSPQFWPLCHRRTCEAYRVAQFCSLFTCFFPTISSNEHRFVPTVHSRARAIFWLIVFEPKSFSLAKKEVIKIATLHPRSGRGASRMRRLSLNALLRTRPQFFLYSFILLVSPTLNPLYSNCSRICQLPSAK